MRCLVNPAADPAAVPAPSGEAAAFHVSLEGYEPTPLRELPALASELGLANVAMKDESNRLGLPAFKVLGASWALERALRERPEVHTAVAAEPALGGPARVAHRPLRVAVLKAAQCSPKIAGSSGVASSGNVVSTRLST